MSMTIAEINDALESMARFAKIGCQKAADGGEISDTEINKCKCLIKPWEAGEAVEVGACRTYGEKVYRVRQEHTTQADWTPDVTPALWTIIDMEHAGTVEDPIPATRGMEYVYGKIYLDPEDGQVYQCERIGANPGDTIILQYLPHELIGQYFSLT